MNKKILTVLFCAAISFAAHSQTVKNNWDYKKLRISIDAGLDYTQGTSGTVLYLPLNNDFAMPSIPKGFGAGFDGAYFLSKQYGVGLKYRFFTGNYNKQSPWSEYADVENEYDHPIFESTTPSFREQTHAFGPAVYARWFLGRSKWNVSANAGVVYLYDKLSKIEGKKEYYAILDFGELHDPSQQPQDQRFVTSAYTGTVVGFTLSSGIRYQLTPEIGIGVSANGLFTSLSRMKNKDGFYEEYEKANISRKINRIGVSAGIDYCF